MPKVYLTKQSRQQAQFSAWVYGCMKISGITQEQLAKRLNISQQALSRKLKMHHFSYSDLISIFEVFEPDHKELDRLLGIDRHRRRNEQT